MTEREAHQTVGLIALLLVVNCVAFYFSDYPRIGLLSAGIFGIVIMAWGFRKHSDHR